MNEEEPESLIEDKDVMAAEPPFRSLVRGPFYHTSLESDVMIAAHYSPGFCEDLTHWNLAIRQDGDLRQVVRVSTAENHYAGEWRFERVQIPAQEVQHLMRRAEAIGFCGLEDEYDARVTDVEGFYLSFRCEHGIKRVRVDGPGWLISRGNKDVERLLELWNEVRHHAPFS